MTEISQAIKKLAGRIGSVSSDYRHIAELQDSDTRSKCAEVIDRQLLMIVNELHGVADRIAQGSATHNTPKSQGTPAQDLEARSG